MRQQVHQRYRQLREQIYKLGSVYWATRAPFIFRALQLRPGEHVLDLGCNSGLWSRSLARSGAHVVGVDLDAAAVQSARNRNSARAGAPTYLLGSAEQLPFDAHTQHAVVCIDVLDIVPDDRHAVQEIWRILRPGGRLIITVISRERRHVFVRLTFAEHLRNYCPADLRDLLTQSGFEIQQEFTFYRLVGGLARELSDLVHRSGLSRIRGLGLALGVLLAACARLDAFLPCHVRDGGIGFVATKPTVAVPATAG